MPAAVSGLFNRLKDTAAATRSAEVGELSALWVSSGTATSLKNRTHSVFEAFAATAAARFSASSLARGSFSA